MTSDLSRRSKTKHALAAIAAFFASFAGALPAYAASATTSLTSKAEKAVSSLFPSSSAAGTTTPQDVYSYLLPDPQTNLFTSLAGDALAIIGIAILFPIAWNYARGEKAYRPRQYQLIAGSASLLAGILLIVVNAYYGSSLTRIPVIFSNGDMSASIWEAYKANFSDSSSARIVDPSQNNVTTSEGESYAMLRAVWLDDKASYDASWQWTESNLKRPTDSLFSWRYGELADGTYGVLIDQGGNNTASDADSDIALSLIFAYARWHDPAYLASAKLILNDMWNLEVISVNGTPYLAADNLEKQSTNGLYVINPSYFSPYAYRLFALVDTAHPWNSLVDSSYSLIQASSKATLDTGASAGLPPDWITLNKTTGAIGTLQSTTTNSGYGFDAMRVPWRLALDWQWNQDARAKSTLDGMSFLQSQWRQKGLDFASYSHDGTPTGYYEAPAIYGGDIGYFIVSDPQDKQEVYRRKLLILFDPDSNTWREPLSYYDNNWAWFGMSLYNNLLPNLAGGITAQQFAKALSQAAASAGQTPAASPTVSSTSPEFGQ